MRDIALSLGRVLLPALLASCSQDPNVLLFNVSNVPARAEKLAVNATLGGKPAMSGFEVPTPLDGFAVRLAPETSGHLALSVAALDSDGCTQGTATPEYDLPIDATRTELPLSAQSPRKCGSLPACDVGTVCSTTKPTAFSLESLWAFSPTDIWAAGHAGTMLHFDGTTWTPYDWGISGTPTENFWSIWGSAPDDIWAVGTFGLMAHYDGVKWTKQSSLTTLNLNGVWGVSKSAVWAVGDSPSPSVSQGAFYRYNGNSWSSITTAGTEHFNAVWADDSSGSTLVYACGNNGLLVRFDASKSPMWAVISSYTTVNLFGIWGTRSMQGTFTNTLFAAGGGGTILRIRYAMDSSWAVLPNSGTTQNLIGVRGDDTQGLVYAYGQNGTVVSALLPGDTFSAQSTSSSSQIFGAAFSRSDKQGGLVWFGGAGGSLGFLDINP